MSWDLIVWKKEDAVDFVPSVWSNSENTMYKYPSGMSQQKIRQLIYECKDIASNYKWYEANVRRGKIKNLKRAQALCLRAQYSSMSDHTDDEEETKTENKRKIMKPRLDDYEYEYDDDFDYEKSLLPKTKKDDETKLKIAERDRKSNENDRIQDEEEEEMPQQKRNIMKHRFDDEFDYEKSLLPKKKKNEETKLKIPERDRKSNENDRIQYEEEEMRQHKRKLMKPRFDDDFDYEKSLLPKKKKNETAIFKIPELPNKHISENDEILDGASTTQEMKTLSNEYEVNCNLDLMLTPSPHNIPEDNITRMVRNTNDERVVEETTVNSDVEIDSYKSSDDTTISGLSSKSTLTNYSNLSSRNVLNEILKNQVDMKYFLKDLSKRIDQMDNLLKFTRGADVKAIEESPIISKLPCSSLQDILTLENFILEKEKFTQLVNFLYLVGGETEAKTIYYILRKLLTNEVAVQYSGIGKKGKLAFCKLEIYNAVVAAARMRHTQITDECIRKTVSLYLAQTKSRISSNVFA